jgi:D-alanyl-lipoteichoic acid acyltransferase DltB (MBOAT superfamily)
MLFNTPRFFLFFSIFFLLYSFVFLRRRPRILLILVGSLIFYAGWNYRFVPLLVFSATADYFLANSIAQAENIRDKKLLLSVSVAINLGILAIFKYADFAMQSVADLLAAFGYHPSPPVLNFVLPVGISFYTFQSMSYTIDVYRGQMKPHKGLLQFTAALAFFPQLVAGPILRAREILPQLEDIPTPTWPGVKHGFLLITVGLFKKTLADLLAGRVDAVFNSADPLSVLETWTGVLAFAAQIYGDFSGYTDMAIGIALLLGFRIPINFRLPYFATSPVEFWRRWHISLSSWLRDYLYISLGGNRNHRYRNIFITMLLGGLWHGAAWTFIAWGFFHGCLIAATHWLSSLSVFRDLSESRRWFVRLPMWLGTLYLVLIGWVFFRAVSIESAFGILGRMHSGSSYVEPANNALLLATLCTAALVVMHLLDFVVIRWGGGIERRAWLLWPILLLLQFVCFFVGVPSDAFIYFQF